ncbi:hypothetical protein V3C99_018778 [Haemonchus contortus]
MPIDVSPSQNQCLLFVVWSTTNSLPQIKMAVEMQQIIELILCIFLPPLAIFIHSSDCNIHVAVNIILCFFFYLPAIIHALWYCFFRG